MDRQKNLKVIAVAEAFGLLNPPRNERKFWIHPFIADREDSGRFFDFYHKIRTYPEKFFEYYRMSIKSFDELLMKLRGSLTKQITRFRTPISAEERLTVTLRFVFINN